MVEEDTDTLIIRSSHHEDTTDMEYDVTSPKSNVDRYCTLMEHLLFACTQYSLNYHLFMASNFVWLII